MTSERIDIDSCQDRMQVFLHRARYDFVLAHLPPGRRVLEIGTGTGTFARELSQKSATYVGVEFDPAACEASRRKTENRVEIIRADARCLPFADDQFSFIVCLEVLEHLGDFQAGIREIHRCIQRDGTTIISVPYRRFGKRNATEYHLYEPGENELISNFRNLFSSVQAYFQYFEETWWMTLARLLHVRRILGIHQIYSDLIAGLPNATQRCHISEQSRGMNSNLILVATGKK